MRVRQNPCRVLSTTVLDSRYTVSTGADRWSRCDRAAFTDLGQSDYDLQQRDRIEYVDVPIRSISGARRARHMYRSLPSVTRLRSSKLHWTHNSWIAPIARSRSPPLANKLQRWRASFYAICKTWWKQPAADAARCVVSCGAASYQLSPRSCCRNYCQNCEDSVEQVRISRINDAKWVVGILLAARQ